MGKNTKVNKHIEIMKPLQKYVFSMYSKCVCVYQSIDTLNQVQVAERG